METSLDRLQLVTAWVSLHTQFMKVTPNERHIRQYRYSVEQLSDAEVRGFLRTLDEVQLPTGL